MPAPKGQEWRFATKTCHDLLDSNIDDSVPDDIWQPSAAENSENITPEVAREGVVKLRPLAHIPIAEQTITTLMMICLAEEVESKQGNPATDLKEVHDKNISSYGNRLFCRYDEKDKASHSWGATTTYGKYFDDYKKFLARPAHFASEARNTIGSKEAVFIVDLDLKGFFDRIDRNRLVSNIKGLDSYDDDPIVEKFLEKFKDWVWSEEAKKKYLELFWELNKKDEKSDCEMPKGLPQGLVASGFLANLYMLAFDQELRALIGTTFELGDEASLKVVDYCRYVDDMKIVVTAPRLSINKVKSKITEEIGARLEPLGLKLNENKTKAEVFVGRKQGISTVINDIQSKISGPISSTEVDEQLGHLESLLVLSDSMGAKKDKAYKNDLANIEANTFDVRDDTLKRFAANKISKLLASKRHFIAQDVDDTGKALPGQWDYLQERMARKFIACWSKDPSLVLLLKKGLELFPDPWVLRPVLENLRNAIDRKGKQAAVAAYCLSEVYRHSATVIHRKNKWSLPAHADVDGFFELLQEQAAQDLSGRSQSGFEFDKKQATLLLLVRGDSLLCQHSMGKTEDIIAALVLGLRKFSVQEANAQELAFCILIANQIKPVERSVIRSSSLLIESTLERPFKKQIPLSDLLRVVGKGSHGVLESIVRHARAVRHEWVASNDAKKVIQAFFIDQKAAAGKLTNYENRSVALVRFIKREDNPLASEITALTLLLAVVKHLQSPDKREQESLEKLEKGHYIDVADTKIKLQSISLIPNLTVFEETPTLEHLVTREDGLGIYDNKFVNPKAEDLVLRRLGQFLRGCLIGSVDWTGSFNPWELTAGYKGVKSTAVKRSFGLAHGPEVLTGPTSPVSGWVSGLLTRLLRWPGILIAEDPYHWPVNWNLNSLKDLVDDRLTILKKGYCTASGIPSVQEVISLDWDKEQKDKTDLKVVMVQSMFPSPKNIEEYGFKLNDPKARSIHRKHVAAVSELIVHHVFSEMLANGHDGKKRCDIDLIIWPEIAVHEDDLDILVSLSRKTKSIIYAGLGFMSQHGVKGPNNCAVWIVPRKKGLNQKEVIRFQGKANMTTDEMKWDIKSWRPYQLLLELKHPRYPDKPGFVLTGSICYDATDIALSSDLRDKSNAFFVAAYNKDINTFDAMIDALHYHMYQHVVLVNTGVYGGSVAKAPYKDSHKRLIAHVHGNSQVSLNTFEMNMFDFRRDDVGKSMKSDLKLKTKPAGMK